MNPENKCAHLDTNVKAPSIQQMFDLQRKLQDHLALKGKGIDFSKASWMERVEAISVNMTNMTLEFAELLERLPHKRWKTYSDEQRSGWMSKEHELETKYELIDMFHFFLNIGLCLDIDGEEFCRLYAAKNKENIDRQNRGY